MLVRYSNSLMHRPKHRFFDKNQRAIHTADLSNRALSKLASLGVIPHDEGTETFHARLQSALVFYDKETFADRLQGDQAFSLERAITKVAAVDVQASMCGELQNGQPWPGQAFFMDLKPGDERGLAPEERRHARKKIIASQALIYRFGGYPYINPIRTLPVPQSAYVFTMPGIQFEHPFLDYQTYIIDSFNQPERYHVIQSSQSMDRLYPLKAGFVRYIQRDAYTGAFSSGFSRKSAIFLDSDDYYQSCVKDITMIFGAAEKCVDQHKMIYFKLPLMGMGYFAQINGCYDIKNYLIPIYVSALKHVLTHHTFPHLDTIEIPVFSDEVKQVINLITKDDNFQINGIKVKFGYNRDVLFFSDHIAEEYNLCVLNPGDANSIPGNETGAFRNYPTSVESSIGNNTDIRYIQSYVLNPVLINPMHWIGMSIANNVYRYHESITTIQAENNRRNYRCE